MTVTAINATAGDRYRNERPDPEVAHRQAHANELCHQCEEVQDEQVADRERPPELAEALQDQPRVADSGDSPEAQAHLLVDDEDRHQQQQRPQQTRAVVLTGLRISSDAAGVVVADHDDEAWAHDGQ